MKNWKRFREISMRFTTQKCRLSRFSAHWFDILVLRRPLRDGKDIESFFCEKQIVRGWKVSNFAISSLWSALADWCQTTAVTQKIVKSRWSEPPWQWIFSRFRASHAHTAIQKLTVICRKVNAEVKLRNRWRKLQANHQNFAYFCMENQTLMRHTHFVISSTLSVNNWRGKFIAASFADPRKHFVCFCLIKFTTDFECDGFKRLFVVRRQTISHVFEHFHVSFALFFGHFRHLFRFFHAIQRQTRQMQNNNRKFPSSSLLFLLNYFKKIFSPFQRLPDDAIERRICSLSLLFLFLALETFSKPTEMLAAKSESLGE